MAKVNKINEQTIYNIKRKSALAIPDRATDRGWSATAIKQALVGLITNANDSVISEINRIVEEVNTMGVINTQLSENLKTGMKPIGVILGNKSTYTLLNEIQSAIGEDTVLQRGCYFIVHYDGPDVLIEISQGHNIMVADDGRIGQDSGDLVLETNDLLVYLGVTGVKHQWMVINNTYPTANASTYGVVMLATEQEALAGTNQSKAMTPKGVKLAIAGKVDKVEGKGLSANDYTDTDKQSVEKIPTIEQDILDLESGKVDKNNAITAGTKTKITYDSKGLVTSGDDLVASDIPQLAPSKITQDANNRFVTDTEKSTWNGKQNALTAGDGISISGNVISADSGLTVETWNTATKTLALSDSNKLFKCSYTDNQTLTIPTNATVAFPIGTMITFLLTSTYKVTFSGASGVTLTSMDSLAELKTQYGMASLIKIATNTWQLVGALE